jgi:hypothetical protein
MNFCCLHRGKCVLQLRLGRCEQALSIRAVKGADQVESCVGSITGMGSGQKMRANADQQKPLW